MSGPSPFSSLIPELFPIIAFHIPLYATPSVLLSLAVTNRRICEIVLPLLHQRLILKNKHVFKMMQRLLDKPELGRSIRELHILVEGPTVSGCFIRNLRTVVAQGFLPHIHTLSLLFLQDGSKDGNYNGLPTSFWVCLKTQCPQLRGLIIRGIRHVQWVPFTGSSGVLEVQDMTILILDDCGFRKGLTERQSPSFSAKLHTLKLSRLPGVDGWKPHSRFPLLDLTLPKLVCLRLDVAMPSASMAFFERHPTLTHLDIVGRGWVSHGPVPETFLPNIRHLKSHFDDVIRMAPILHRLTSLTVYGSVNAQVPYLLRSVLSDGLPNLKSLGIAQWPQNYKKENPTPEGVLWYETKDGDFLEAEHGKADRCVWNCYIHSIVRGAPNLEEMALHAGVRISHLPGIASDLSSLPNLRRIYYQGHFRWFTGIDIDMFTSNVRYVAKICKSLDMVVDMRNSNLPYVAARISRNGHGLAPYVDIGDGYGMQVGNDDEAFPT